MDGEVMGGGFFLTPIRAAGLSKQEVMKNYEFPGMDTQQKTPFLKILHCLLLIAD